jgi:hypothetical protein
MALASGGIVQPNQSNEEKHRPQALPAVNRIPAVDRISISVLISGGRLDPSQGKVA